MDHRRNGAMAVHQCPKIKAPSSDRALDRLHTRALKPALVSIPDACKYMGGVSRAKFYTDVLPQLATVHLGTRHLVVVSSMDSLIVKLLGKDAAVGNIAPHHQSRAV
jgi:hypothetical protein